MVEWKKQGAGEKATNINTKENKRTRQGEKDTDREKYER